MSGDVVVVEHDGPVAWITLNRPEARNAINAAMRRRLPEVLLAADADPDVRAIVLQGAGTQAFCAGADIKEWRGDVAPIDYRESRVSGDWTTVFDRLRKPLIAAVQGHCLGGGLEIALACDIRVAAEGARFAMPEVSLGTIPGAGGTQRLARLVGTGIALDMILSAEPIGAAEAYRIGLASRLCADAALRETAGTLAQTIATRAPLAVVAAKEAVRNGLDLPLRDGLRLELDLLSLLVTSEDRAEAARAFREKRKPVFKGV